MSSRSQHGRNRNGRTNKAQQSTSVLSRLKNLILTPFSAWVGSDVANEQGKRPRHADVTFGLDREGEGERKPKRKRLEEVQEEDAQVRKLPSFQPVTNGYLDPAEDLFARPSTTQVKSKTQDVLSTTARPAPQQPSLFMFPKTTQPTAAPRAKRVDTAEPLRIPIPDYVDPARIPLPLSRDISMESLTGGPVHDSMSPSRAQRFRMRTSLTPQPSGHAFGPSRKDREKTEPPPLAEPAARPVLIRPPPQLETVAEEPVRHTTVPLGAVAETYRPSAPLRRQRSVLVLERRPSDFDMEPPPTRPLTAAEKALQELELYKTPLLPSRLRGSPSIPDMFVQKASHAVKVMYDERDNRPRLGTSEKQRAKRKAVKGKPYDGTGGVKKLLKKRRREEREERKKEKEAAIVTDAEEVVEAAEKSVEELPQEEERVLERRGFTPIGGREPSSLRVGRNRVSVYHAAAAARPRRGFSARYEEEDEEEVEVKEKEAPKLTPMFQMPKDFSFAKDVTPIVHDTTKAKEPPIAALPFSLTPQAPPSVAPTPVEVSKPPSPPAEKVKEAEEVKKAEAPAPAFVAADTVPVSAPAPPTPLFAAAPSIPLIPPISGPSAPAAAPAKPAESQLGATVSGAATSAIPNFFANSAFFNKAPVQITTPFVLTSEDKSTTVSAAGGTLFGGEKKAFGEGVVPPTAAAAPTSLFGEKPAAPPLAPAAPIQEKAKEEKPPTPEAEKPALAPSAPSTTTGFSFGTSAAATPNAAATSTSASVNAAATTPVTPFLFGTSKAATTTIPAVAPAEKPVFGALPSEAKPAEALAKPVEAPAKPAFPFSFGAAPAPEEPPKPPAFSFGISKEAAKVTEAKPAAAPSFFGTTTPTVVPSTSFFGAPATTTTTTTTASTSATEQPKPAFTFGPTTTTTQPPAAPAVETPKPLWGAPSGFTFGQPAPVTPEAPKTSFPIQTTTPAGPPPTTETKSAFTFSTTPSPAPTTTGTSLFGTTSTGIDGTTKPFSFGVASTPARPVTPPQPKDVEVSMDESPTRAPPMELNGKLPEPLKTPAPFSFTPTQSPFGAQTITTTAATPFAFSTPTAGPFGTKPIERKPEEKPPATAFASFGQTTGTGFSFGKPAEPARPATTSGAFSFGQPSVPPINTGFGFGTNTGATSTSAFGAPSAPASPAFGQPAPFSFGTPVSATATTNPFAFGGSQPASPATASAGLPQPSGTTGGGMFAFGAPAAATPITPNPFAPAGGVNFTLGAPPPATQTTPTAGRQIKKLPSRRGGKR